MRTCVTCLAMILTVSIQPARADKAVELSEYNRHDIRVTTICTQGHVVVVAHSDVGKSGGLDMMQLQQDVNGRIVPMRCDEEVSRLSQASPAARGEAEGTQIDLYDARSGYGR